MFDQLSSRIQDVLKRLRGEGRLTESHVDAATKDLRLALLEADVHFRVARTFTSRVRERAIGQEILASLTAPQQVLKIMRDEMVELLGGGEHRLELDGRWPAVILMAGLSGSGKTTTAAKLGRWLRTEGRHPALASVDVQRPAAIEQLERLAAQVGLRSVPAKSTTSPTPIERAQDALREAREGGFDVLILDTAGRLHIADELMEELKAIARVITPVEILFVADSMTGQDAVKSASAFAGAVPITGHVLTKLDGDARGGAALSIVSTTGRPIKFVGLGEKLDALEPFRPERMASRILGMGDVLTLIEKAEQAVERDEAEKLVGKLRRNEFSLEDFRAQLKQMRRLGSLSELLSLLPSAAQLPGEIDESELGRFAAILDSMTPAERAKASILDGSRRRRIAHGSGCSVADVNRLLRRFGEARKMAKAFARGGSRRNLARLAGRQKR